MSRDESTTFRRREALSAAGATLLGLSTVAGGRGRDSTDDDTQEAIPIETEQDLQAIEEDLDGDYVVQTDIELSGSFTPIAADEFAEFTGTLDGQGHEITGLEIDEPGTDRVGLFTRIGEEAVVQDLHLRDVDVTVSTSSGAGALAGRNDGTVLRCSAAGEIVNDTDDTSAYTGGLVGGNFDGQIIESFATVRVRIPMQGGPLDKYSTQVGGLISENDGTIEDCYSIGDVAGDGNVGGFVQVNSDTIEQCFSAGIASARKSAAGFAQNEENEVDCYWDAKQLTASLTEENAQSLDTDEMTGADAANNLSGFDFEETWATVDDSEEYPVLQSIDEETQLDARPDQRRGALDLLDGDGSADDPYHVTNRNELALIESDPFGFYVLEADMDLSLRSDPIGPFAGSLDGRGHELTGMSLDLPGQDSVGVFSQIYGTARIEGVRVTDVDIIGDTSVGGFAGQNRGTVRRCSVEGEVTGEDNCGIFVGVNSPPIGMESPIIEQCWAEGDLSMIGDGITNNLGGFTGRNTSDGVIRDCYVLPNLTMEYSGGFTYNNDGEIENCFAAVTFEPTENVTGFCPVSGVSEDGCYWDVEKSGVEEDGSDAVGLLTEEMQGDDPQVTMPEFDFEEVWSLVEDPDDYPELRWEQPVVPAFTAEPENPDPGEQVSFDAGPTSGGVESFDWELGDGTEAAGETVTHTYDEEGIYQVTLSVGTLLGGTRETTGSVIVGDALQPLPCGEGPPQPVDGFDDTLHRDVRGTGEFTIFDVQCLFKSLDHPVVAQNPDLFGFSETDSEVDIFDVQALFEDLTGQS